MSYFRWGRTTISGDVFEESLSPSKAWAEAWPHQEDSKNLKATFGPVKLFRLELPVEASEEEQAAYELRHKTRIDENHVLVSDMSRGQVVSWEWDEAPNGDYAISHGIRPLGRIITNLDRPSMRGSDLAIQVIDDDVWIFDPADFIDKGIRFYKATD